MEENMIIEEIARKLRATAKEYGEKSLDFAFIVSGEPILEDRDHVCGIPYVHVPTMSHITLGDVKYKTARFFEEV